MPTGSAEESGWTDPVVGDVEALFHWGLRKQKEVTWLAPSHMQENFNSLLVSGTLEEKVLDF